MGLSTILNLLATRYSVPSYSYSYSASPSVAGLGGLFGFLAGFMIFIAIFGLAIAVWLCVVTWKLFVKMKANGWESLLAGHNAFVLFDKVNIHPLWILAFALAAIPVVGWIAVAILGVVFTLRLCQGFGKSTGFAILTIFFSPITLGILAFGAADWDASRINDGGTFAFLNYRKNGAGAGANAASNAKQAPKEDSWVSGAEK